MQTLRKHLGFWIGLIVLVLGANLAALYLRGRFIAIRQLSVDGILLGCSVVASALAILVLWVLYARKKPQPIAPVSFRHGMLLSLALGFPMLLLVVSLGPGTSSLGAQREYIIPPAPKPPINRMGTIVMFANGITSLSPTEAKRLRQQLDVLNRCTVVDLKVVGFASSAPFATYNEDRNLRLANRRATTVTEMLAREHVAATSMNWPAYQEMVNQRRIRDVDESGRRIERQQALNRRVEILWQEGDQCLANGELGKPK